MEARLTITGVDKVLKKLSPEEKEPVIKAALFESAVNLVSWVAEKRLTGPRPIYLGVVTNRLRSSIASGRPVKSGKGYSIAYGTNVSYGRVHEFGFTGNVGVREHVRKTGFIRKNTGTKRAGRKIGTTFTFVRQHNRHMNMPARPFLRPSLEAQENHKMILEVFSRRLQEALERS